MYESGAIMTTEFERFGEELERCDWYALPIKMQRMYMIVLSDTQNPIEMYTYGGIVSNRETIKKVYH